MSPPEPTPPDGAEGGGAGVSKLITVIGSVSPEKSPQPTLEMTTVPPAGTVVDDSVKKSSGLAFAAEAPSRAKAEPATKAMAVETARWARLISLQT